MTGKEFSEWMDKTSISYPAAAELFGVSEQTLYNWRSTVGVPPRKLKWVLDRMASYAQGGSTTLPDRLTLEVTAEQFDLWNRAALNAGQIVRDWASDILDAAAILESTNGPTQRRPYRYPKPSDGPSSYVNDRPDLDPS